MSPTESLRTVLPLSVGSPFSATPFLSATSLLRTIRHRMIPPSSTHLTSITSPIPPLESPHRLFSLPTSSSSTYSSPCCCISTSSQPLIESPSPSPTHSTSTSSPIPSLDSVHRLFLSSFHIPHPISSSSTSFIFPTPFHLRPRRSSSTLSFPALVPQLCGLLPFAQSVVECTPVRRHV